MAQLSADEIFEVALLAGFTPDQATTMTAIALAESGGEASSLNDQGEYSVGLWQINRKAHPKFDALDLNDPLVNARAAFEVSRGGADISPWTVTHQSKGVRYAGFRDDALAAAALHGHPELRGNFDGVEGYGHPAAASYTDGAAPYTGGHEFANDDPLVDPGHDGSERAMRVDAETPLQRFLKLAVAQEGDEYEKVAPDLESTNPSEFDCSGLVRWAANKVGIDFEHASFLQYFSVSDQGGEVSVEEALRTPGALLFKFDPPPERGGGRPATAHVAISLGDGRTMEAMGENYGVKIVDAKPERWTNAGVIPQFAGQSVDMEEVLSWRGHGDDFAQLTAPLLDPDADGSPLGHDDLFDEGDQLTLASHPHLTLESHPALVLESHPELTLGSDAELALDELDLDTGLDTDLDTGLDPHPEPISQYSDPDLEAIHPEAYPVLDDHVGSHLTLDGADDLDD